MVFSYLLKTKLFTTASVITLSAFSELCLICWTTAGQLCAREGCVSVLRATFSCKKL